MVATHMAAKSNGFGIVKSSRIGQSNAAKSLSMMRKYKKLREMFRDYNLDNQNFNFWLMG